MSYPQIYFGPCLIVALFLLYYPNMFNLTKRGKKNMNDTQLKRIADAIEEILQLVKLDQEKTERARLREPDDIKGDW